STQSGAGLETLWSAVDAHEQFLDLKDLRRAGERRRLAREIVALVRERVGRELTEALDKDPELNDLLDRLVARTLDPYAAADQLYRDSRARR
ncbi:MAG: hypothetical protein L3J73_02305, partial [Thermoplasmata archaeon]|nr:hypothetical protein [Thermoplasmata archaeon]